MAVFLLILGLSIVTAVLWATAKYRRDLVYAFLMTVAYRYLQWRAARQNKEVKKLWASTPATADTTIQRTSQR